MIIQMKSKNLETNLMKNIGKHFELIEAVLWEKR